MFTQCFHGYQQSVPMSENVTTDTNSLWPCQTMLLWIPTTVCGHVRQCYHGYQQSVAMSENVTMDIMWPCQRMLPRILTVCAHVRECYHGYQQSVTMTMITSSLEDS